MARLSHKRQYGRAAMLRALAGAGQFAHLSEATIAEKLAIAVSYSGQNAFARYWGVPPVKGDGGTYRASAAIWLAIATSAGALCCLCGKTDYPPISGCPQLARLVCPTWLEVSGAPRLETYPFCRDCGRAIDRISEPLRLTPHPRSETDPRHRWCFRDESGPSLVLSLLLANPSFRRRVERHAETFGRLRFDPRR